MGIYLSEDHLETYLTLCPECAFFNKKLSDIGKGKCGQCGYYSHPDDILCKSKNEEYEEQCVIRK